ncbi:hypothetical protein Prudu_128S000600 [Prunus dulcis]|uniref:F-box family protein with DUF295 n=1 Tax=Prunus dulcis TaxID=3755 RepID=A0A5H2XKU5_PRUDU|nr:hypothetical protein Prudu_128S000600 [Prunus dulcis]
MVHLTLPHEFRGCSDRECQDLRLGILGVPRPARIAARLTLCPRDLPGLRIRLTTVPCILPERLELTCVIEDLPADQADHSPLYPASRRSAQDPPPGHSELPRHQVEKFAFGQNTGETLPNFRQNALDICLTSFGDAGTVRARNADQANYGPLNPVSLRLGLTLCHRDLPGELMDYQELTELRGSFVPDIRQVSDTHRIRLEFQSGIWIESCHFK